MRMLSLFSGIGGIDLAAKWAGIKTVAFCEIEPFCQKVLQKHWPDVPIFPDVKQLNLNTLQEVLKDGPIDIVAGGYPCQPFSVAGKREGENDDRHLWPEVYRLLKEINPNWFVGENVAGHVTLGLDQVLSDLDAIFYSSQSFIIPAAGVNAPHKRDRVFITARNSNNEPELQANSETFTLGTERRTRDCLAGFDWTTLPGFYWEENKPPVCGVDDGAADGFHEDRLKALGNAVVPQQMYPIFKAIAEIEGLGGD